MPRCDLHLGDALTVLKELADESVDACVTDPPYGLSFMGNRWDYDVPSVELWREVLRVLKPGGHLLSFGGTRTYHRMVVNIEDAGFEIRDQLQWLYGSGFPKSLDVSKAIDAAAGVKPKDMAYALCQQRKRAGLSRIQLAKKIGCTESSIRDWEEGRARHCGKPVEWIVPSTTYRMKLDKLFSIHGTDKRKVVGKVADRRGDATVIGLNHSGKVYGDAATNVAKQWQGWGTALKPASEPICLARKPLIATVAQNVQEHGTGALNIDGCRIEAGQDHVEKCQSVVGLKSNRNGACYGEWTGERTDASGKGRWPSNVLLDQEAAAILDEQSGATQSSGIINRHVNGAKPWGNAKGEPYESVPGHLDFGGASRFFYVAKAATAERNKGADNNHPTVKPVDLMRYLVRMITPIGATVLDPFMGSGTTGIAADLEACAFIGIEIDAAYFKIAEARINAERVQKKLFAKG